MYLHYRDEMGLEEKAPILAARSAETADGQVLILWVRQLPDVDDLNAEADEDVDDDDENDEGDSGENEE